MIAEEKKKIYYLSTTYFVQVDMGILHLIAQSFDITYGVVMPFHGSNFSETELRDYCEKHSIKLEIFVLTRRERDPRIGFELATVIKRIKSYNPDLIYTFSFDNPFFAAASFALPVEKTIVFIHDAEFHSGHPFQVMLKIGRQITTRRFKAFQVFSKNQEKRFKELHPHRQVRTIPLAMSDYGDAGLSNKKSSTYNFLFFGSILPYKGLEYLITAANALTAKGINFKVTIAGRCDDWDNQYKALVDSNPNITTLIRRIDNQDIPQLFAGSHFLVLPYTDATQSGPLMIAYNYNVPAIASYIPAFKESVENGVSGYLFESENASSLESAMLKAIGLSDEEYNLFTGRLKNYADQNFSPRVIAGKYKNMFLNFIGKSSTAKNDLFIDQHSIKEIAN